MTTPRPAINMRLKTPRPVVSAPIQVELTIANEESEPLVIVNPEVGPPPADLHWTASDDAYRVGLLTSFGLMQVTLTDADAAPVASKASTPWVTPLLGERILQRHESVTLCFDLNELFAIDSPGNYLVCARYGKGEASGSAEITLAVVSTRGKS